MSDARDKEIAKIPKITAYSDISNAEIFKNLYVGNIKFCRDYGGWFIYNGKIWKRDSNDLIKLHAMDCAKQLKKLIPGSADEKYAHIKRTCNNSGLNAMLECAKPLLAVESEDFDKDEYLFNCENGTINLLSGELCAFQASQLITKIAPVIFDREAKCPLWLKFVDEIFLGKKDLIDFMQKVVGYSMTSLTNEQSWYILYGSGRNGKSKFLETIIKNMGGYALSCPSSTFIKKNNTAIPNDIARLKGSRIVTAIESNQNVELDESIIKQFTGDDRITARFLNKEFFDFFPTFKIFLATNHKPNIRGTDKGIWRRIKMIPFDLQITEEQEDKELGNKLKAEASGILNWMVEGFQKYKNEGLAIPKDVVDATNLYKEEEDDLGQFIKEECTVGAGLSVSVKDFKEKFKDVMGYYKGQKVISEYMHRNGFKHGDGRIVGKDGKQFRGYQGIELNKVIAEQQENMTWTE